MSIEQRYTAFEKAKNYTKQYELDSVDSIVTKQEDGYLGYLSAGQFATTGSNIFTGGQIVLGNITITGDITAQNFVTSSTLLFTGSTNHGSLIGDMHTYTGSVRITGSLDTIGNSTITGSLLVNGSTTHIGNTIMSGSIQVSGSQTFTGTQTTTGSQFISGSSTQIGNNILLGDNTMTGINTITGSNYILGNTIMSGSLEISGSQTRYGVTKNVGTWELTGSMFTSGSTVITGNTSIGGNLSLTGSINVSGSFTGSINIQGNLNVASGSAFYRAGNKLFNYGSFFNTTTQSGSANTAYSVLLNSTDIVDGFSIVSGSRITAANTGIYNLQFSSQLFANDDVITKFSFWLAYTGSNVPNTNSEVTIPKEPNPGGATIIALNLLTKITAGDYIELKYSKTTTVGTLQYLPDSINPTRPSTPATIVTLTQIA
jgi:cytoskeletal protein CcmA (bactofilin family)